MCKTSQDSVSMLTYEVLKIAVLINSCLSSMINVSIVFVFSTMNNNTIVSIVSYN